MTQPQPSPTAAVTESTFITVIAWIFIIGGAISVFISISSFFIVGPTQEALFRDTAFTALPPGGTKFLIGHTLELIALAMLTLSVVTLVSSVGLLRRRNWARLLLIAMLGIGAVYLIANLFLQPWLESRLPLPSAQNPQDRAFQEQWQSTVHTMRVSRGILSVAVAALLAWVIARLSSRRIRAEFHSTGGAA
jgi:hypothetical protein